MRQVLGSFALIALALLSSLLAVGCGPPTEPESEVKQRTGLSALAIAYGQCTAQSRGLPPRSEKALRSYIEKQGPQFLASLKVDNIDDMFVSPRDGQPYVVIYGKRSDVVAYEAVGADGTRWIAHNLGGAEQLDEAAFKQRVPDAK